MKVVRQDNINLLTYFKRQLIFASVEYILPAVSVYFGIRLFMEHEGKGILFNIGEVLIFFPVSFLLVIVGFSRLSKVFNTHSSQK